MRSDKKNWIYFVVCLFALATVVVLASIRLMRATDGSLLDEADVVAVETADNLPTPQNIDKPLSRAILELASSPAVKHISPDEPIKASLTGN